MVSFDLEISGEGDDRTIDNRQQSGQYPGLVRLLRINL